MEVIETMVNLEEFRTWNMLIIKKIVWDGRMVNWKKKEKETKTTATTKNPWALVYWSLEQLSEINSLFNPWDYW